MCERVWMSVYICCRTHRCHRVSQTLLALHTHSLARTHHHHPSSSLLFVFEFGCYRRMKYMYETGGYKNLSYMLPPSNQWSRFEARTHTPTAYGWMGERESARVHDSYIERLVHTYKARVREEENTIGTVTVAILYIQQYNFYVPVFFSVCCHINQSLCVCMCSLFHGVNTLSWVRIDSFVLCVCTYMFCYCCRCCCWCCCCSFEFFLSFIWRFAFFHTKFIFPKRCFFILSIIALSSHPFAIFRIHPLSVSKHIRYISESFAAFPIDKH